MNLVLEYEKGGECTQSDATDFELFSISLHFPNPTLKTLSALAEKRNTAEVVFGKTHKLVGENNRSAAPYIPLDHNLFFRQERVAQKYSVLFKRTATYNEPELRRAMLTKDSLVVFTFCSVQALLQAEALTS